MSFFSYSPWADAARYGAAAGDAISQGLIQQPQRNAEAAIAMQNARQLAAQFAQEQARVPLETDLLKAQIKNTESAPELRASAQEIQRLRAENDMIIRQQMADAATRRADKAKDYGDAGQNGGVPKPKPLTQPQAFNQGRELKGMIDKTFDIIAKSKGLKSGTPITGDDDIYKYGESLVGDPQAQSKLREMLSQVVPTMETETNKPHWWSSPVVTTNAMNLSLPADFKAPDGDAQGQPQADVQPQGRYPDEDTARAELKKAGIDPAGQAVYIAGVGLVQLN